jgi:hypothetical protein
MPSAESCLLAMKPHQYGLQTAFHLLVSVLHVTSNFFQGDLIDSPLQDIVTGELLFHQKKTKFLALILS